MNRGIEKRSSYIIFLISTNLPDFMGQSLLSSLIYFMTLDRNTKNIAFPTLKSVFILAEMAICISIVLTEVLVSFWTIFKVYTSALHLFS